MLDFISAFSISHFHPPEYSGNGYMQRVIPCATTLYLNHFWIYSLNSTMMQILMNDMNDNGEQNISRVGQTEEGLKILNRSTNKNT